MACCKASCASQTRYILRGWGYRNISSSNNKGSRLGYVGMRAVLLCAEGTEGKETGNRGGKQGKEKEKRREREERGKIDADRGRERE